MAFLSCEALYDFISWIHPPTPWQFSSHPIPTFDAVSNLRGASSHFTWSKNAGSQRKTCSITMQILLKWIYLSLSHTYYIYLFFRRKLATERQVYPMHVETAADCYRPYKSEKMGISLAAMQGLQSKLRDHAGQQTHAPKRSAKQVFNTPIFVTFLASLLNWISPLGAWMVSAR